MTKKLLVVDVIQQMFWIGRTKSIAIGFQCGQIYIVHIVVDYQNSVIACIIGVSYHCFYLFFCAMIISFVVTFISTFI